MSMTQEEGWTGSQGRKRERTQHHVKGGRPRLASTKTKCEKENEDRRRGVCVDDTRESVDRKPGKEKRKNHTS